MPGITHNAKPKNKIIEETTDYKTFIFFRDAQKWGKIKMDVKEIVSKLSADYFLEPANAGR